METLRILTALEDLLGSLGPQINIILSRAITLENNKEGSGNVLLEDPDIAAILQMTKEKLSGQNEYLEERIQELEEATKRM